MFMKYVSLPICCASLSWCASDTLTWEMAWAGIQAGHPALEAAHSQVEAKRAAAEHAARGPNPTLGVDVEDALGTGAYRGMDAAQTTLRLEQAIEWGGKRGRGAEAAGAETRLAQAELARRGAEFRYWARGLFLEGIASRDRLALSREAALHARLMLEGVSRRVREGAASQAEEFRARAAVAEADLDVRRDSSQAMTSRRRLAIAMGRPQEPWPETAGALDSLPTVPEGPSLAAALAAGPETAARAAAVEVAQARQRQAEALGRPDLNVGAGVRHAAATGDLAWVASVSLPLPWRDRNQSARAEAGRGIRTAMAEASAAGREAEASAADIRQEMDLARDEAETLAGELIPAAEKAMTVLEEGWRRGRFGAVVVLDAKGEWFRQRKRRVEALHRYHMGYAGMRRLLGDGLGRGPVGEEGAAK